MDESKRQLEESLVYRITMDERLDDSFVRLLIAPLNEEVDEIKEDHIGDWGKEIEEIVDLKNFTDKLRLKESTDLVPKALRMLLDVKDQQIDKPDQLLWRELSEGQVFLSGRFRADETGGQPDFPITIDPQGDWDFLRIDTFPKVKNGMRQMYSEALLGRRKSDDTTHQR